MRSITPAKALPIKVAELSASTADITIPIKLVICPRVVVPKGKASIMAITPTSRMANKVIERIRASQVFPLFAGPIIF